MKIGEALNERKRLMNRIPELLKKLQACVTVVEGQALNPAEPTAAQLKASLDSEMGALRELIISINRTNNATKLPGGLTIMEGIAMREHLKQAVSVYQGIASHIRPRTEKDYRDQERVKYVVAEGIHSANIKQSADRYSETWRKLDTELQQANWTTDIIGG